MAISGSSSIIRTSAAICRAISLPACAVSRLASLEGTS
jgi:hypothetical protein